MTPERPLQRFARCDANEGVRETKETRSCGLRVGT